MGSDAKESVFARRGVWLGANWALAAVVAGALVLAVLAGRGLFDENGADDRHREAVDAARQRVLNFMTSSPETVDADIARVQQGATGQFADEYAAGRDAVRESVISAQASSQGEILFAALVTDNPDFPTDSDSAGVLVACDAHVTNKNTPEGRTVHYRVIVEMSLEDGEWLIGKLEFVQ